MSVGKRMMRPAASQAARPAPIGIEMEKMATRILFAGQDYAGDGRVYYNFARTEIFSAVDILGKLRQSLRQIEKVHYHHLYFIITFIFFYNIIHK